MTMSEKKRCDTLPSSVTAYRLATGDMQAIPSMIGDMALRAALIAIGSRIAGAEWKDAAKYGIAGSTAIEISVILRAIQCVRG